MPDSIPAQSFSRRRISPAAALLVIASALVTAGVLLTQLLAHRLRFDPALGPALLAGGVATPLRAAAFGCAMIALVLAAARRGYRWAIAPLIPLAVTLGASVTGPLYPPHRGIEWSLALLRSPARVLLAVPWTVASGLFVACVLAVGIARRAPVAAPPSVHGSARLAGRDDLRSAGMLGGSKGLLLGRWPARGRGRILRDDSQHHALVTIPPAGGKTTGPILGTLLSDAVSSAFVVDPKAELWSLSAGWRAREGQRCLRFGPATGEGLRWNPFDEIERGPGEHRLVSILAEALLVDSRHAGSGDHWIFSARALFRALALHALYTLPGASIPTVLDLLHDPRSDEGLDGLFREMLTAEHDPHRVRGWRDRRTGEPTPTHPEVARIGRAMIETPDRERGSIVSTLATGLALWGDEVVAAATARSEFSLRELADRDDPVTLYVTLPYSDLDRMGPLVRMMLAVLTLRVIDSPMGRPGGRRLLLLLDEFRALGRVLILEQMLAYLRGYGVRAVVVVQDLAQIRQVYSDRESITGNCQLQVFASTQNLTTRQHASRLAGEATIRYRRRSVSTTRGIGRRSSTLAETDARRPLLTEGEIGTLPDDHLLIFKSGLPPILAGKLPYYEHAELARRAALPPPRRTPPSSSRSAAAPSGPPPPPPELAR